MDKLCGVGSLQVVYHRFTDGVQVVRCVLDFYKSVSEVEQSYSMSINKLVKSSAYTFHSNILMQWLGSDPYEEIGTVKCSWQRLGSELSRLADHHANKANDYITTVRKQLQGLLPRLEEMRIKLKNKVQQLKAAVDAAEKNNFKEKQKYFQIGGTCLKIRERIVEAQNQQLSNGDALPSNPKLTKLNSKDTVLTRELEIQESVYKSAHRRLVEAYEDFSREIRDLYKEVEEIEKERVKTLKLSLQDFAKTLSNTAPTYLEGMKRIVMSVDDIDASSDIVSFVDSQRHLMDPPKLPQLEQHVATCQDHSEVFHTSKETDSMCNGNRTPSLQSQKSLSDDELLDSETEPDKVKGHNSEFKQPAVVKVTRKGDIKRGTIPDGLGQVEQTAQHAVVTKVATKPLIKPKPECKSGLVVSENSTSSSSSGHVSSSSSHMTSSSSHVTSIIEKMEVSRQHPPPDSLNMSKEKQIVPSAGKRSTTLPRGMPTSHTSTEPVKSRIHSIRDDNPTSLPAKERPRTKTVPTSSPSPHHRTWYVATEGDPKLLEMLSKLQFLAKNNDCYKILGVEPTADTNELTRARREKNREFHPDHFTKEPDRKARAEEQLSVINQIYQDVLKREDTRSLYDQLCHFRQFYSRIPDQVKGLDKALSKLQSLHKTIKKAQFPLPVLEEMELAIKLMQARIDELFTIE